jgi:hypothetical protein
MSVGMFVGHKNEPYFWAQIPDKNPQVITNILGERGWYENGYLHREDGPAIERPNGTKAWYYRGILAPVQTEREFNSWIRNKAFW